MPLLPLVALLLAPVVSGEDGLTGPGVSRALAERRAAQIADVRYAVTFDVTQGCFTVRGAIPSPLAIPRRNSPRCARWTTS